jgi:hypothetical protein
MHGWLTRNRDPKSEIICWCGARPVWREHVGDWCYPSSWASNMLVSETDYDGPPVQLGECIEVEIEIRRPPAPFKEASV